MKQSPTTNSLAADATEPPTQDKLCAISGRSKSWHMATVEIMG